MTDQEIERLSALQQQRLRGRYMDPEDYRELLDLEDKLDECDTEKPAAEPAQKPLLPPE